jgi:hypothetical protein
VCVFSHFGELLELLLCQADVMSLYWQQLDESLVLFYIKMKGVFLFRD